MCRNAKDWWTPGERRLVPRIIQSLPMIGQDGLGQFLKSWILSLTLPAKQQVLFTLPNVIKVTHTFISSQVHCHHPWKAPSIFFLILGDSMNTVPHYNKLWRLFSHIWGNHRGQHIWSAVDEPCPGQTTFTITVSLLSGKYAALLLTMSELSNCVPFFWFPLLPSVTYH